jgi:hypothetical protein
LDGIFLRSDSKNLNSDSADEDMFPEEADQVSKIELSSLREELLCSIARQVVPSQRSIEVMRAVCQHWRSSIPTTRGPWLVLSPMNIGQPTIFLRIVQGGFVRQNPLFTPPVDAYCWSCCWGLMALRVPGTNGFSFCVNCGRQDPMAHLPDNLHLTNLSESSQLFFAISQQDQLLRWARHEDQEWNEFDYALEIAPKSVDWINGIACIATAPSGLIIDWLEQRLQHPIPDELEDLDYEIGIPYQHPAPAVMDFELNMEPTLTAWGARGHHTFNIEGGTYVCVLLRHSEDSHIEVRLFVLVFSGDDWILQPANNIGQYAVFLGANQAFAAVSDPPLMPNTAYVVNDDGFYREARVIAINFLTGQQTSLPYPQDVGPVESFEAASWLYPLPDVHC